MLQQKIHLYVFRHGETDWNRDMRWQGHTDVPLNETGRKQARDLIPLLKTLPISLLISSDLSRALETAKTVAEAIGRTLISHEGFRELGFGQAEGLTFDQIGVRFGEVAQQKIRSTMDQDLDFALPGGESKRQLLKRSFAALDELICQHLSRPLGGAASQKEPFAVGLATHGGVIRTLMQHCGFKDRSQVTIPNGSLFLFEYDCPGGPFAFISKKL